MIVVDASALVESMVRDRADPGLLLRLGDAELHAPHLIDVELLHALRTLGARRAATEERIEAARAGYRSMMITRYPHVPLWDRVWSLRHNLSAYDAIYVALAESLAIPLVTADARLTRAPGLRTEIEVYDRPA